MASSLNSSLPETSTLVLKSLSAARRVPSMSFIKRNERTAHLGQAQQSGDQEREHRRREKDDFEIAEGSKDIRLRPRGYDRPALDQEPRFEK